MAKRNKRQPQPKLGLKRLDDEKLEFAWQDPKNTWRHKDSRNRRIDHLAV
jgi:hypothetical protein